MLGPPQLRYLQTAEEGLTTQGRNEHQETKLQKPSTLPRACNTLLPSYAISDSYCPSRFTSNFPSSMEFAISSTQNPPLSPLSHSNSTFPQPIQSNTVDSPHGPVSGGPPISFTRAHYIGDQDRKGN